MSRLYGGCVVGVVGDVECVGTYSDDVLVRLTLGGGLCGYCLQRVDVARRVGCPPEGFGSHHGNCVMRGGRDVTCRVSTARKALPAVTVAFARHPAALAGGQAYQ